MQPTLDVHFFKTNSGAEPVRDWLKSLSAQSRQSIGEDIRVVQFRWPLGMPLVRKLDVDLWEVRSRLEDGIARVLFTVEGREMVLLHGFIKKSNATPQETMSLAQARLKLVRSK